MRAAIFGATGMVGGEVLEQCLANYKIKSVLAIGRRKSGVEHSKLKEIEHNDFLDFTTLEDELADVDVCFYCLGVYQAQERATPRSILVGIPLSDIDASRRLACLGKQK